MLPFILYSLIQLAPAPYAGVESSVYHADTEASIGTWLGAPLHFKRWQGLGLKPFDLYIHPTLFFNSGMMMASLGVTSEMKIPMRYSQPMGLFWGVGPALLGGAEYDRNKIFYGASIDLLAGPYVELSKKLTAKLRLEFKTAYSPIFDGFQDQSFKSEWSRRVAHFFGAAIQIDFSANP